MEDSKTIEQVLMEADKILQENKPKRGKPKKIIKYDDPDDMDDGSNIIDYLNNRCEELYKDFVNGSKTARSECVKVLNQLIKLDSITNEEKKTILNQFK